MVRTRYMNAIPNNIFIHGIACIVKNIDIEGSGEFALSSALTNFSQLARFANT